MAQAAATASVLLDGRFAFGVGSGEALNMDLQDAFLAAYAEHVLPRLR
jgi:hypothetical protein